MHGMKSIEEVVASMSQPGSGSATCTTWRDGSLVPDPSFEVDVSLPVGIRHKRGASLWDVVV